ncbi:MAG: tetratricopeptide repeat protein [Bacteroidales bacterium]
MASKKKKTEQGDENLVAVEDALSKTEQFIEDNKNILLYSVIGIAVLVLAIMGYQRYIAMPNERQAQEEMFMAEQYFGKDSLDLALHGDGSYMGFIDITDEYGNTKSGNLAHYYAGVSFLKLGQHDKAIEHLKKFKSDDEIVKPMALGNIANAYMEKGDLEEAVKYYKKAAKASENDFTSAEHLFRLGLTYELLEDYEEALDTFKTIDKEYPKSPVSENIDKYIARAQAKIS